MTSIDGGLTAGIVVYQIDNITISKCIFKDNLATSMYGEARGGSLYFFNSSYISISESQFTNNSVVALKPLGGALFMKFSTFMSLTRVVFTGNKAITTKTSPTGVGGGAIHISDGCQYIVFGGLLPKSVTCVGCITTVPTNVGQTYNTVVRASTNTYNVVGYYFVISRKLIYVQDYVLVGKYKFDSYTLVNPGLSGISPIYASGSAITLNFSCFNDGITAAASVTLIPYVKMASDGSNAGS